MDNLPQPTPELILIREIVEWQLAGMPRRAAERRRAALLARFAAIGEFAPVVIFRPKEQRPLLEAARKKAAAWALAAFGPREV